MTAVDTDLTCPDCQAGPFGDMRALKAHRRSHQTVDCDVCGETVGALGIGSHRRAVHGIAGQSAPSLRRAAAAGPPTADRLAAALAKMLPGSAPDLTRRLAEFVAEHQPFEGLFAVISADAGPWLCHRVEVGNIAHRQAHGAVVAVALTDVYDHLKHREAR